jgi:hypothetical protein
MEAEELPTLPIPITTEEYDMLAKIAIARYGQDRTQTEQPQRQQTLNRRMIKT